MSAVTGLVPLSTPVEVKLRDTAGAETAEFVSELLLRAPIAKDLLATDGHDGEAAKSIALFAHLATVAIDTIDALTAADFQAVAMKVDALKGQAGAEHGLTLRPMFARDLRVTDRHPGETAKTIALVAALAGVAIETVQALPLGQFEAIAGDLQGPTPPGHPTGGTASAN